MFYQPKRFFAALTAVLCCITVFAFEDGQFVRLQNGGKSLMVENSTLDENKNAVLWTETNTNSQRWILKDTGRGTFNIINAYTGLYLGGISSVSAKATVGQIAKSAASIRGAWELVPVEGEDGNYHIYINTSRRIALGAPASITEGCGVTLMTASTAVPECIKWSVEAVEEVPQQFTKDMRNDMMDKWMARHYKKASSGYIIDNGGWWGDAEMFETVLDAYETTGDTKYATMFDNLYTNFINRNKSTWYQSGVSGYNEYNDDIAWMCIACVRGYLLTGQSKYLSTAKTNFNGMFKRADCYGNDLLQWKHNSAPGTNACINGPAAVCACYLAIATADMSYYDKAIKTYKANRELLYEKNNGVVTGRVFDSGDSQKLTVGNSWSSTYNQGTCLGAAVMLYNYTGDEMYKKDADAINTWTKKNLANSHGIINACQTVRGDLCGFKGILLRYMRMYAAELGHPENYDWIAKNAYHAWNNRNSSGIISSAWMVKSEEDFKHQEGTELKTFESFGNSTCLSAAFNAHLGVVDQRNAYDRNEAEDFNFVRNTPIVAVGNDDDGSGMAGVMKKDNYVGYRNVDFGNRAASAILVRANLVRSTSKLNVYMDAPDAKTGTLLGTISADEINVWKDYEVLLDVPVAGMHDIYFQASGVSGANLASINWFQFKSDNLIFGDLTNNGGKLTSSLGLSEVELASVADDDVTTNVSGEVSDPSDCWLQYESDSPMLLQGYTLNLGNKDSAPKSWKLLASQDGEHWDVLSEQTDTFVVVSAQRFKEDVQTSILYSYYKLVFTMPEGVSTLSLAEWQLLGRCISAFDITSDGGTVTDGMEAVVDHKGTSEVKTPATIVYKSNGNYRLNSYSITLNGSSIPLSWSLEGSNNGSSWSSIDSRTDVTAPYDGSSITFRVNPSSPYIYYRLKVQTEDSQLAQWQLFGNMDFGSFYADVTSVSCVSSCDGSSVEALLDDNGNSYATVTGDSLYWNIETPVPARVIGYSILCGNDPELDPKDIVLYGIDDAGEIVPLSARTLSFNARGTKVTYTVSSSKLFSHFVLNVKSTASGNNKASIASFELYTTALFESGSESMPDVLSIEASEEGLAATEVVSKLNDQSRTTRYRANFNSPVSITYSYSSPVTINMYTLTSSKDDPTRDPKDWVLMGSNDCVTWTTIDIRQSQAFSHRYATQFYTLEDNVSFSNYKLMVTSLNGGNQIQLAELQYLNAIEDPTAVSSSIDKAIRPSISLTASDIRVASPAATTLRIYDITGKLVKSYPVRQGENKFSLFSKKGIYLIVMQVEGVNLVRKVSI